LRQISALKGKHKIITIGYTPVADNRIIHYPVKRAKRNSSPVKKMQSLFLLLKKDYRRYYNKALDLENILSRNIEKPDVIIANDWNGLYLASKLKSNRKWEAKIYFDAHEYAPREFDASIKWRLLKQPVIINALKNCKKYITVMSTVCDGLAREYERFFDFPDESVEVISNAAEYEEALKPRELRNKIRLIHHGGAMKQRKLELMIKMMRYLDPEKYELTFMLVPSDQVYYNYLLKMSHKFKHIHFIDPVVFSKIPQTLNEYDIGVFILEPKNFNYKYALPNKLFEFIQARLAIAIGPSIEMANIIKKYDLGVVSDTFVPKSLAKKIAELTPEKLMEYKRNSDKYAKLLSAENNALKINMLVDKLSGDLQCVE
jgi:hypothetical protein